MDSPHNFSLPSPEQHKSDATGQTSHTSSIAIDSSTDTDERQRAEEQLQFQATILRYVTDSVIVTTLQGIIIYWNEGASAVFGYTAGEMIGKCISILSSTLDLAQNTDMFAAIVAGHDFIGERQCRCKDGTMIWIEGKTTIVRDTRGTAIGLIGIFKDITASKEAEERLRQSEQHFRTLVENMDGGIMLTDARGIITYVSPSTTRMVGFLPEEFIGHRAFERMVYPADQEAAERLWVSVIEEPGKSHTLEYRTRRKDGSFLWIELVGLNLLHEPGIEAIVWNYRDITERKEMEQEIARAVEQLEIILQNVDDGIVMVDASGRLIYANDILVRWQGFSSLMEMLAAQQETPWHRHDKYDAWDEWGRPIPAGERPATQALQGKPVHALIQYRGKGAEKTYWMLIRAQPIFDARGQVQFVIIIYTDRTEQKELEQRKDHFISMASHELKTPLTVLRVYTQLLLDMCKAEGRQDVAPYLSKINDQINKLTRLVVDLLDISKMQAGQIEMVQEEVNMEALVRDAIESLQPTTGHRLLIEGEAPGTIIGDRGRLGQVLIILLNNAIKYSPRADTVVVRLVRPEEGHTLTVAVQDFGIGIGKEHQGRLFQRFYRVLSKQDKTFPGMGIGLYIAHEIIRQHGGKMWVESIEGSGSTFFFSLPM